MDQMINKRNLPRISPEILRIEQVADLVNISERTIYRMLEKGLIPRPLSLLGNKRWRKSLLCHWIELNCPNVADFDQLLSSTEEHS